MTDPSNDELTYEQFFPSSTTAEAPTPDSSTSPTTGRPAPDLGQGPRDDAAADAEYRQYFPNPITGH